MWSLLWFIVVALFVLWIIGLGVHWPASVVWVLFIIAVVLLIVNLITNMFTGGRRIVT